jgi:tRNA-dihydrouridine synthase B
MVFTELISSEALVRNNKKTFKLMQIFTDERPVGIQIFGHNPKTMQMAVKFVEELNPDLIDINMGCCAQKVCSNGAGAALLKDVSNLFRIAQKVVTATDIPVTAKIRLGWDDSTKNYIDILHALEDAGIRALTVHGRTRAQQYTGNADWESIEEIASNARIPVIGNGDISSFNEAKEKIEKSSCAAVMIGRCALGNPWIFSGRDISIHEKIVTVKNHLNDMVSYYGDYGIILARKHLVKYFQNERNASQLRKKLVLAQSLSEMTSLLDSFFLNFH